MYTPSSNGSTRFLEVIKTGSDVLVWLTAVILIGVVVSIFVRRKLRPTTEGSTILLAHTFRDATDIIPARSSTTPGGLYWQYLIGATFMGDAMRGVYSVELPFTSGVHLLGIPKKGEDFDISTWGSVMEPVELEGDYPDYFSLYADKGEQMESRFVLDPKAMQFTVDFCKEFSWEIVDDALYFASENRPASFGLIDQFVKEIRPALETKSDRTATPQMTMPYAHFEGRSMNCPICSKRLIPSEEWLGCPDGHGVLVTAVQLSDLRNIEDNDNNNEVEELNVEHSGHNPVGHTELQCPYCQNTMKSTPFAFTNVQIDVCPKCMFRWLDAGEAKRLFVD